MYILCMYILYIFFMYVYMYMYALCMYYVYIMYVCVVFQIPFGIAQIGKAFRNEITPRNFIFRSREFEQMEIEYFIAPDDDAWQKVVLG